MRNVDENAIKKTGLPPPHVRSSFVAEPLTNVLGRWQPRVLQYLPVQRRPTG